MGLLEALFNSPSSAFSRVPPDVALAMTYNCSKLNEGMFTFALGVGNRGDTFLVPAGQRFADLRMEADGRVAIGFSTNVRAVVEAGAPSLKHDAVNYYSPSDIEPMAQDLMHHLCSTL
jgi:hypothetical protein